MYVGKRGKASARYSNLLSRRGERWAGKYLGAAARARCKCANCLLARPQTTMDAIGETYPGRGGGGGGQLRRGGGGGVEGELVNWRLLHTRW